MSSQVSALQAAAAQQMQIHRHGSVIHALLPSRVGGVVLALVLTVTGFTAVTQQSPTQAAAGINEQLNFQARLLTAAGGLTDDGDYNVRFRIYSGGDGVLGGGDETLEWTEVHDYNGGSPDNRIRVANGYLSAQLGSITAFGTDVDWNEDTLWLSIDIGGSTTTPSYDGEMSPFMRFSSTPYAFNANQLDGIDSDGFVQLGQGLQADGSTNDAIEINKTSTGNFIDLQDGGTTEFLFDQDGNLTLGSASDNGRLVLHDGNGDTTTLQPGDSSTDLVFILPNAYGSTNQCIIDTDGGGTLGFASCAAGGLQAAYDAVNTIVTTTGRDIDITLADTAATSNFDIDVVSDNTVSISRLDNAVTDAPAQLLLVENLDTDLTIADGITVTDAGGGLTDAIDVSDADINNAINVGANTVLGTTADLDFTNFDVTGSSGDVTTAGDIAVNGGDLTTSQTTFNLINTNATTLNIGGAATALEVGATTGTTSINNSLSVDGNTTLGTDQADSLEINAGESGATGADIRFTHSSFQNCTALETDGTGILACGTDDGTSTLQGAYDGGNSITTASSTDIDFVLASGGFDIDIADNTTETVSISRLNGAGTADPAQLLLIENLDTDRSIADGLRFNASSGGGLVDAIDATDGDITNALNAGANNIIGTTGNLDFTNFDVVGASGNTSIGGTLTVTSTATFNDDVDINLTDTDDLIVASSLTGTTSNNVAEIQVTNSTSSGQQRGLLVENQASSGVTDALILVNNADTDTAVTDGLQVTSEAGTIIDGLDVSDADITNAINVGANTILGTTAVIDFTNFDVDSSGNVTAIDVAVNGGDLTTNQTTFNLLNSVATTVNAFGATTALDIGATTGYTSINNELGVGTNDPDGDGLNVQGGTDVTLAGNNGYLVLGDQSGENLAADVNEIQARNNGATATLYLQADGGDVFIGQNTSGGLIINSSSAFNFDSSDDLTIDTDTVFVDSSADAVGFGTTSPDATIELAGNRTQAAWGFNGVQLQSTAATYTDSSTAGSGTATNAAVNSFGIPTLAATNSSVTTTNAANVYIAGAPAAGTNQTITNAYALWVDAGNVRLDGDLEVNGGDITSSAATASLFNTTPGTVNIGGGASAINLGAGTSTVSVADNLTVAGDTITLSDGGFANCTTLNTNGSGVIGCDTSTFATTLQNAYDGGNSITTASSTDIDFVLSSGSLDIDISDNTANTVSISRLDGAGTTDPAQLLLLENLDTDRSIADGLLVTAAGGGLTDGIDVSDSDITNALNIGANAIAGTNFSVTGAGAVTAVGVNAGTGLIQGTGGITVTGTASINTTGTANTSIGNATGTFELNSNALDISTAGVISGATGITSSGTINFSGLTASRAVFTDGSSNLTSTGTSAALLNSLSDETGTGVAVFGTSPEITTSLTTGSASFDLLNTTATTVNAFGAATTLELGAATGTTSINNSLTVDGNVTLGTDQNDTITIYGESGTANGDVVFGHTSFQSCTALETDASGILTCGTDDGDTATLQNAYVGGNTITTTEADGDLSVTLDDTTTDRNFDIDIVADNTVSISRTDNASTEAPAQLLLVENLDTNLSIADGLTITDAGGGLTDAIDVSDADITNAINIGANAIAGTNFSVSAAGAITAPTATDTINGLIINSGALSGVTGYTQTSGNFAFSGGGNFSVDSAGFDVTTAGAVSGVTTLTASGNINTTGGAFQLNGTDINTAGTLTNVAYENQANSFTLANTFNSDVTLNLADTENLFVGSTVTGTNSVNLQINSLINNTSSGTQNVAVFQNDAGSGTTETIISVDNNDTDTQVTDGISVTSAGGGILNGLDVSDADITNAISIGANAIAGTNFSVTGAGAVTTASTLTLGGLGATDNASFICRNGSNILAGCNYTPLNQDLTDDITDALDIQEGSNNYININTTNSSETVSFGNTNTNPDFNFLGSGNTTFDGDLTLNGTTSANLTDTENFNFSSTVTGTNNVNLLQGSLTNNTSSGTQRLVYLQNNAGSGTTDDFINLYNADTDTAVTTGISIGSDAGGIGTGINVSDSDITTAINIGANEIAGTNFSVTGAGAVTAVGVNSGTGLIQGTGGLTVTGAAVNLNASSNFPVNIATGTSSGAVTIGNSANSIALDTEVVITSDENDANDITPAALEVQGAVIRLGDSQSTATFTNGIGIKFHDQGAAHGSILFDTSSSIIHVCNSSLSADSLACDAGNNPLAIDLGNERIGVGVAAPTVALDVAGDGLLTGDLGVNGGDLTTTAGTFNLLQSNATTVNAFNAATTIDIGAQDGETTIRSDELVVGFNGQATITGNGTAGLVVRTDAQTAAATSSGNLFIESGDASGSGASNSGNVTLYSGTSTNGTSGSLTLATGNVTAGTGNSGSITLDPGSSSGGTAGSITIGGTNASALTLGRAGLTTANAGALTVTELLTANGGVTIDAESGASGDDVFFNHASFDTCTALETVSGILTCGTDDGGSVTLQNAYDGGNSITTASSTDIDFVLSSGSLDIDISDNTANTVSISRLDGAGTTDPAQLLLLENLDTDRSIADGLLVTAAGGGLTDGIDVSDSDITNALNIGANAIAGTNFSVTGAGAVTAVGVDSGSGLLQGIGGLAVTNGNFQLTGGGTFQLDSSAFDVSTAGVLSGITGYTQSSGNFAISGSGTFGTGTGAISLNGATNVTGSNTFDVGTGATTLGGVLGVTGLATFDGDLRIQDSDDSHYARIAVNNLANDYTISIPTVTAADTFCLATAANCIGLSNSNEFTAVVGTTGGSDTSLNSSVAEYTADGTSDQDEINSAISAVSGAGGGKVLILEGTYTVDGSINLLDNVEIIGSGREATTIFLANGSSGTDVFAESTNPSNWAIRDLTIDINSANTSGNKSAITIGGVGSATESGGTVDNVEFMNFDDGNDVAIDINNGAENFTVTNSFFRGGTDGIDYDGTGSGDVQRGLIAHNVFDDLDRYGIVVTDAEDITIQGNAFTNWAGGTNDDSGVFLDQHVRNIIIDGNTFTEGSMTGIYAGFVDYTASANVSISNNTFDTLVFWGIYGYLDYGSVDGNTFRNISTGGAFPVIEFSGYYTVISNNTIDGSGASSGIDFSDALDPSIGVTVIGNTIANNFGDGIEVTSGHDDSVITGNTIMTNGDHGIDLSAVDDTLISNNRIIGNTTNDTDDGINIDGNSDRNQIIGNVISDSTGTGDAIHITSSNADDTYISNNQISGTGADSITDSGTGTVYANQLDSSSNLEVTPGGSGAGYDLELQGGNATSGNNNGGDILLNGGAGAGTGVQGLVVADTFALETAAVQNCTGSPCAITQSNVDSYGAILITTDATGYTVTLGDPTLGASATGRIIYITNSDATDDFVLSANGGAETINLKPNTTATMIWNGSDWTAAGASSSTDLQAAYDNTAATAGGAEIVLDSSGTGGLTIRNDNSTPISGALLEVQSAIGTNLFSVNNAGTEFAANGGAEDSTNFNTDWVAEGSATRTRETSASDVATGVASVQVDTTAAANDGVQNELASNPATSTAYQVSFTGKLASGTFTTLDVQYTPDGGSTLVACTNYSTQTLITGDWTKVTCDVMTGATAVSDAELIIRQTDTTARTFHVDNLSMRLNSTSATPPNVQIGGGQFGGAVTLFTLDQASSPPVASGDATYYGSMYYDTVTGRIQCYEADGWGACGAPPNNIITLTPEYSGAVLNGSGVGTMTADFCADESGVLQVNASICGSGEAVNYYAWTSPQATSQTYSIYLTFQLPTTFQNFIDNNTITLDAYTTDTSDADVDYEVFRSTGSAITECGSDTTVTTSNNIWQTVSHSGNENDGCSFAAGDRVIFKLNMTARNNDSVYVSDINFTYTND